MAVAIVTHEEKAAVIGVQCDFAALASLLTLVRAGVEDRTDAEARLHDALDGLRVLAEHYGARMDGIPGLYPLT